MSNLIWSFMGGGRIIFWDVVGQVICLGQFAALSFALAANRQKAWRVNDFRSRNFYLIFNIFGITENPEILPKSVPKLAPRAKIRICGPRFELHLFQFLKWSSS